MNGAWILPIAVLLPLALAVLWLVPPLRPLLARLAPWSALPALSLSLFAGGLEVQLPWLLLGSWWLLDDLARAFLGMTALLWLLAGLYARYYPPVQRSGDNFWPFWLLTLAGNLTLIVSRDVASFYAAFALMTFAGYGLVVHAGTEPARRAGRIYLIMAVIGEMLILAGLLLAANSAESMSLPALPGAIANSPHGNGISLLLLLGFGVKAGLPLLHMWLPLAHPVAPTPASAVLSGAMIKAGLLAWLLLLPLGMTSLPAGQWLMVAGLVAAFSAALIGVSQRAGKAVLAYSSVSQMGLITVMVGLGLWQAKLWPLLLPAVVLYVIHHGLAKGALFLAAGALPRSGKGYWLVLTLPALALAGLPLTSGAVAKLAMKEAVYQGTVWPALPWLLSLAAVATTLLVSRFIWLNYQQDGEDNPPVRRLWLVSVAASLTGIWWLPHLGDPALAPGLTGKQLPDLLWPIFAGIGLAALAWRYRPGFREIPRGDLIVVLEALTGRLLGHLGRMADLIGRARDRCSALAANLHRQLHRAGTRLLLEEDHWRVEGALAFGLLVMVLGLLWVI